MSNLLPPKVKRELWGMYRARSIILVALFLCVLAAVSFLALVPSYLVLQIGWRTPAQQSVDPSQAADRAVMAHTQAVVAALSPLLASTTASALITDAIGARPAGITIDHVTAAAGSPGTIILTGSAGSNSEVSAYQRALQADPHFSGVSVPVADLIGSVNGEFSITLNASF